MKKWFLILILIAGFLYLDNKLISTEELTIKIDGLPNSFHGTKIVHVSDLHDATFGEKQERLASKIQTADPDYIFITGDLIDSNRYELQNSLDLIERIVELAPVYYVTGNHEFATNDTENIKEALERQGVNVLSNEQTWLEKEGERIRLIGIEDPLGGTSVKEALNTLDSSTQEPTLVISHRPEEFDVYASQKIDIVFSGHAHGGQFRIPGLGGLVAPGQGVFPKYTSGAYREGNTTMVVSRGLGNSIIPIRIFNMPEIVVVTLKKN